MTYDMETITALESGTLVLRDFWTAHGKTKAGVARTFAYWTGEDNVAVNVPPPGVTTPVSRNFIGGGTLLQVPEIVDAIGLEARSVSFGFDHISTAAERPMDMVFGHNVRVARVEFHRGVFDPDTWNLLSAPHLLFSGRVDGAEVDDAAAGGEGVLQVNAVNSAIDLTFVSYAMDSDEQQRLRDGDRFNRHADTAIDVPFWWGQEKSE